MRVLKIATARDVMVFLTDEADHVTGLAGLELTVTASKGGAAFASISPVVTDRGSGWYAVALTDAHTDTAGDLALHITATGADPADVLCQVVAYDPTDAVALGLSRLDATVGSRATQVTADAIEADTQDVQARLPAALVSGRIAADAVAISGSTAAADAVETNIDYLDSYVGGVPEGVWTDPLLYLTTGDAAQDVLLGRASQASVNAVQGSVDGLPEQVWTWSAGARSLTTFGSLATDVAAAVWAYLTSAATTLGSMGALVVAKLGLLTSGGGVTIVSPTTTEGDLNLTRGDDYTVAQGNAIEITNDGWLDMSGWDITEVRLTVRKTPAPGKTAEPVLLTVTDVEASRVLGPGDQTLVFELEHGTSAAGTLALVAGTAAASFDIQVTHDGGDVYTPHVASVNVTEHVTRPA